MSDKIRYYRRNCTFWLTCGTIKKDTLKENQPIGRKLDFLLQEMNREVNTMGSKGSDLEITDRVVVLKCELEKIREQIQNIE